MVKKFELNPSPEIRTDTVQGGPIGSQSQGQSLQQEKQDADKNARQAEAESHKANTPRESS